MSQELNICHLYPRHMSLYGDRGNIISLSYRAKQRNINVNVQYCEPGEKINSNTNILVLGGGQDVNQDQIVSDLLPRQKDIESLITNGMTLLAICGGYQLLGEFYETQDKRLEGLSLVDLRTYRPKDNEKRIIGNVIADSPQYGTIWGFENHAGRTHLGPNTQSLATVTQGGGNNGTDKTEGVISNLGDGYILGSYFHTFLPKNPPVTDYLIQQSLKLKELETLNDEIENTNKKIGLNLKY